MADSGLSRCGENLTPNLSLKRTARRRLRAVRSRPLSLVR